MASTQTISSSVNPASALPRVFDLFVQGLGGGLTLARAVVVLHGDDGNDRIFGGRLNPDQQILPPGMPGYDPTPHERLGQRAEGRGQLAWVVVERVDAGERDSDRQAQDAARLQMRMDVAIDRADAREVPQVVQATGRDAKDRKQYYYQAASTMVRPTVTLFDALDVKAALGLMNLIEPVYRMVLIPGLGLFGVMFGLWYTGL